jgi:hypothetical protein
MADCALETQKLLTHCLSAIPKEVQIRGQIVQLAHEF